MFRVQPSFEFNLYEGQFMNELEQKIRFGVGSAAAAAAIFAPLNYKMEGCIERRGDGCDPDRYLWRFSGKKTFQSLTTARGSGSAAKEPPARSFHAPALAMMVSPEFESAVSVPSKSLLALSP